MAKEMSWELYRTFLGVLREGSLSGASRALGLTQPTVGRHIAELEETLGVPLFTRSQMGLLPTEAAIALRGHAEDMSNTAASFLRAAEGHGDGIHGTVCISASEVVGAETLPPILAGLAQRHPTLRIELVLTNRVQDLLRREADIAIRMLEPKQSALIARRVADVVVGLHAHESYLARRGVPTKLADLDQHVLIGYDEETAFIRAAVRDIPWWRRESFSFRVDNDLAQLALIRAGCGIGGCQVGIAKRDGLVRVLPKLMEMKLGTWITMHEDLRGSARCKVVFDTLATALSRSDKHRPGK